MHDSIYNATVIIGRVSRNISSTSTRRPFALLPWNDGECGKRTVDARFSRAA